MILMPFQIVDDDHQLELEDLIINNNNPLC
jgi:hypothetical protein